MRPPAASTTAWAAAVTALHRDDGLELVAVLRLLTSAPRTALGLAVSGLVPGAPADLALFHPDAEWTVQPEAFHTKGRHTPFAGETLQGRVLGTWVAGRRVFERAHEEAADGASSGVVLGAALPAGAQGGVR